MCGKRDHERGKCHLLSQRAAPGKPDAIKVAAADVSGAAQPSTKKQRKGRGGRGRGGRGARWQRPAREGRP